MAQHIRYQEVPRESAALDRARFVGDLLDSSLRVPGTEFRVGLDPILGVVPFLGDWVASVASLYIVFVGFRLGLPARTLVKMLGYVAADFFLGSVPVLGTVVDAFLKVNNRNVAILESHVANGS